MQTLVSPASTGVVQPQGPINASNATTFQQQLLDAIAAPEHAALLIDMSGVESLDSAGLMALVTALTRSQQLQKEFGLCGVPAPIRIIFEMTQLDQAFPIFESHTCSDRL